MSQSPQIAIKVVTGPEAGQIFVLEDTCFIGNLPNCEICLSAEGIASMHARVGLRGGSFTLTDLTTEADIRINGSRVKSRKLSVGDKIDIAGVHLEIIPPETAEESSEEIGEEDELTVVGVEDSPLTEVVVPPPADYGMDEGGPVIAEELRPRPEYDSKETALGRKRRERLAQPEGGKSKKIAGPVIFGLMVVVIASVFIIHSAAERKKLAAKYAMLVDFAMAHEDDPSAVLARYRQLRQYTQGRNSRLTIVLDQEIRNLEVQISKKQKEFENLLMLLDEKARALMKEGRHDEAVALYRDAPEDFRSRIVNARTNVIAEIEASGTKYREEQQRREQALETQRRLVAEKAARERLGKLGVDLVNALLAHENLVAIDLLESVIGAEEYEPVQDVVERVLLTVRSIVTYDRLQEVRAQAGEEIPEQDGPDMKNLSAIARAVLLVRNGDMLAAESILRGIKDDFLADALSARLEESRSALMAEKKAATAFLVVWRKVIGKPEKVVPTPEDCIAVIEDVALDPGRKDLKELCAELIQFSRDNQDSAFTKRYASLFDFVFRKYPALLVEDEEQVDPGNGKVIQVDGVKCFIESDDDLVHYEGGKAAFFESEAVFFGIEGSRDPLGVRVNVTDVFPFNVVSVRQLCVSLPAGAPRPAIGKSVLISHDIATGRQFVSLKQAAEARKVYAKSYNNPDERPGKEWNVRDGRIILREGADGTRAVKYQPGVERSAPQPHPRPRTGDFELMVEIGSGAFMVKFDTVRSSSSGCAVLIGNLSFVLGSDGSYPEGIYIDGNLAQKAVLLGGRYGSQEHVSISRKADVITLAVNNRRVSCRLSSRDCSGVIDRISFGVAHELELDNVTITVSDQNYEAGIVGLSQKGTEVLLSKGVREDMQSLQEGQQLYFFCKDDKDEFKPVTKGQVSHFTDEYIVCLVPRGHGLDAGCVVASTPEYKESSDLGAGIADPRAGRKSVDEVVTYARVLGAEKDQLSLELDMPVYLPSMGYIYRDRGGALRAPTGELLAFSIGAGTKAAFRQFRSTAVCRVPAGQWKDKAAIGTVISSLPLSSAGVVDVRGRTIESLAGGYTSLKAGENPWIIDLKAWQIKAGRLVSKGDYEGAPQLVCPECFPANAQFDVAVKIENPVPADASSCARDIVIELFCPGRQAGVTFAIGSGAKGALLTGGRSLSMRPVGTALDSIQTFSTGVVSRIEGQWREGRPVLKTGIEYFLRTRRIGETVAFYINGKRVCYVHHPGFNGDLQLRLCAPGSILSVGRTAVRDLPGSAPAIAAEKDLGDFGYVLQARGNRCWVDADMNGIEKNAKVSIMAVENVIKGEASKTVVLRKVAAGVVATVGSRTAEIIISEGAQKIEPGMKVMGGLLPESLMVTDTRLCDLDKGI